MLDKLLFIFRQILKYKNPDSTLSFCRLLILTGASFIGGGVLWSVTATLQLFSVPIDISVGPADAGIWGAVLLGVGVVLGIWRIVSISKLTTGLLIIHRGMEGMEITAAKAALPRSFSNGRLDVIDVKEGYQQDRGKLHRPESALRAILDLPRQVSTRLSDQASTDLKLAYAGLAPVPLLIAAGYVISSRQQCLVMDFKRGSGWHCLDSPDDGESIDIVPPSEEGAKNIALVFSFSAAISASQIPEGFKDKTYFINLSKGARVDSLSSEDKQLRIAGEIYSFVANLKAGHPALERVHIFMAAQASFSFRLGTILTASVHPSVSAYQYDPSTGGYTWGVSIDSGKEPSIVHLG